MHCKRRPVRGNRSHAHGHAHRYKETHSHGHTFPDTDLSAEIAMSVGAPWQPEEELKASRRPLSASESRTLTNASSSGQNARRPWTGVIAPRSSEKKSIQDGSEQGRPSHAPRDRSRYIGSESHGSEEQRCAKTLTTQILSRVAPRGLHLEHSFAKKVAGSLKAKGGARGKSPGKLRELGIRRKPFCCKCSNADF